MGNLSKHDCIISDKINITINFGIVMEAVNINHKNKKQCVNALLEWKTDGVV